MCDGKRESYTCSGRAVCSHALSYPPAESNASWLLSALDFWLFARWVFFGGQMVILAAKPDSISANLKRVQPVMVK